MASATYLTYLVRESFRTAQGPRSRTICNITALPPADPATHRPIAARPKLRRYGSVALTDAWSYGGLAVLHQAWEALGWPAF